MQKCNIRYFSSLTSLQKDDTIKNIRIIKNNLISLPKGLAIEILKNMEFENVIKEIDSINNELKGQKMFYYKKLECWLPLNTKTIYKK